MGIYFFSSPWVCDVLKFEPHHKISRFLHVTAQLICVCVLLHIHMEKKSRNTSSPNFMSQKSNYPQPGDIGFSTAHISKHCVLTA